MFETISLNLNKSFFKNYYYKSCNIATSLITTLLLAKVEPTDLLSHQQFCLAFNMEEKKSFQTVII